MPLTAIAKQPPLTHFSFPVLSSQDPALPLKENPEDKLGKGLLEARPEVSGCLFFLPNVSFFMKRVGSFLPLPRIFTYPKIPDVGSFCPQEALSVRTASIEESG